MRVVGLGLTDLEPWWILTAPDLVPFVRSFWKRHSRRWVPFARRQDNDDVACFSVEPDGSIATIVIHDYTEPGWERRRDSPTFYDWFRQAVDDFIEFDHAS